MNILFITPYYKPASVYGGPVQAIAALCEGLQTTGASVTVFTTTANGDNQFNATTNGPVYVDGVLVRYFSLELNGAGCFYAPSLGKTVMVQASQFDIMAINTLWSYPLWPSAIACFRANVPYVLSVHGQLNTWALAKKNFKKRLYLNVAGKYFINHANGIHCTDKSEAEFVARLGYKSHAFVIPHSIHTSEHRSGDNINTWRQRFEIPLDAFVLFFLGRITNIKRPDIAVDVLHAVLASGLNAHLLIAGPDDNGMEGKLQVQAQELGCSNRVHFVGLLEKDEVISALAEVDLLLMPSQIQENFGMSALEALASGVPVLVSPGIPVGKWAQAAGAGRVAQCTSDDFAQTAIEILSQPQMLKAMGKNGRRLAQDRFDTSVIARQTLEQYQAIIATGCPLLQANGIYV
jgi:glycosyltransferase involved in cell wall biosynthesis